MIILTYLMQGLLAILVLSVLVFVHELGHFLFAKWNKVNVLEFAIGFGKVIYQKQYKGTHYSIRLIPLGGYVRMAGDDYEKYYSGEEDDLNSDPVNQSKFELQQTDEENPLAKDPNGWFFKKSILARASIVFAGPLFNFIFAWVIVFSVLFLFGSAKINNQARIGELIPDYPAAIAGLEVNDLVKEINDVPVKSWEQLVAEIAKAKTNPVKLEIERELESGVQELELTMIPKAESVELQMLDTGLDKEENEERYLIGVQPVFEYDLEPVGLLDSAIGASKHLYYTSWITIKGLGYLITGKISAKNIGGPITIFQQTVKSADQGISRLLMLMALINISLGILNLLPIPVLDGGHLLLFFLEAVNRGRLNRKFIDVANQIGLFLLLALMVFAIGNDIFRLFS